MWAIVKTDASHIHVVPKFDAIVHEMENCACQPVTEPQNREDGSIIWLVVHSAWDGRKDVR